ncbi:MAG TPA: cytosine permease [Acidimicrobiales bacterium]|nr:cytosine permease [Acidimicrobiales bacterium]
MKDQSFVIEHHGIDPIPESERHGTPRGQFTLWFAANMQITTVVTGALAVFLGLSFPWAIVAILLGNLVGAIFMAAHCVQGPRLGIPQMIQSRAQFGFIGAILPLVLAIILYMGFFASSAVLGGEALAAWLNISTSVGIVVSSAFAGLIALYGYDLFHRYQRWMSWLFGVVFLYLTIRILATQPLSHLKGGHFTAASFILVVSIVATWQITYSVAVSDYSRYLPVNTKSKSTFLNSYWGTTVATIWMMILGCLGALLGASRFDSNSVEYIGKAGGSGIAWFVFIVIVLGVISANVINVYGSFMCASTLIQTFKPVPNSRSARSTFIVTATIVGMVIALWGQGNFLTNYTNFLNFLLYLVVPWTAVNLTDFYVVRHGHYNVESILRRDGTYGAIGWRAMIAYLVAVAVQIPFIDTTLYEGPLAKQIGGADISWILALIVGSVLYYLLARGQRVREVAPLATPLTSGDQ